MSAISTWHNGSIHDDDAIPAVSIAYVHDEQDATDPDSAIHLAAHVVGQNLAVPTAAVAPIYMTSLATNWSVWRASRTVGIDPPSPSRPPQA